MNNVQKGDEIGYDIKTDYLEKYNGKVDIWEVYYRDGIKKEKNAYNFLFYLVMKKHVSMKKHWWHF